MLQMADSTNFQTSQTATFVTRFQLDEIKGDKSSYGEVQAIQDLGWRVGVIKLTSGEPKLGVQLDLVPDDDDAVDSCTASYTLRLVNHKDAKDSIVKQYKYTFTPGGLGSGYPVFCSWETLKDQRSGFLDDQNQFTVEATVNIIDVDWN